MQLKVYFVGSNVLVILLYFEGDEQNLLINEFKDMGDQVLVCQFSNYIIQKYKFIIDKLLLC